MSAATAIPSGRTAIVHDWFQGYHGSERVVEVMRRALADEGHPVDLLTFHAAHKLLPVELSEAIVAESRLARLPGIRQQGHDPGRWRYLLPLMPGYFRHLDLAAYDLVISSSHACASHVRARPDAVHVCYCHTPMRYAWLPQADARQAKASSGLGLRLAGPWLRRVDRRASRRPDCYIANSRAVRERIERFYGRSAVVIHPPVELNDLLPNGQKENGRFLWVHRLVDYKRPEAVVEAFRGSPYRLTMVGVGPLEKQLRAGLPPNVELRGWLSRAELARLYAGASGFVHIADEDFGISMVESLAAGTPVIALDSGGARDIVRSGTDGVLVRSPDPKELREALTIVAERSWDRTALRTRAEEFSKQRFVSKLYEAIATTRREKATSRGPSARAR